MTTPREQALLELLRELLEVCIDRGCEIPGNLRVGIAAALADHATPPAEFGKAEASGGDGVAPYHLSLSEQAVLKRALIRSSTPVAPASVSPQAPTAKPVTAPSSEGVGQGGTTAGADIAKKCTHERAKRLRSEEGSRGEYRQIPFGARTECWCCGQFVREILLLRSFYICTECWNESDPDFTAPVTSVSLGVWERRKPTLASDVAGADWVKVPKPKGMREPLEVIGKRLRGQLGDRFFCAQPVQFTDNERQVLMTALHTLDAALPASPRPDAGEGLYFVLNGYHKQRRNFSFLEGNLISYDAVVEWSGKDSDREVIRERVYTVTYSMPHGSERRDGSLVQGESVAFENGMVFNVTRTVSA